MRATALAATPTRLKATKDDWQEGLINPGYVISATALANYCPGPVPHPKVKWLYARGI